MNISARIITVLLAFTIVASAQGLTLETEAGALRETIGNRTETAELAVKGTLNLADFEFLALEMKNLHTLDLSGTTVTAYKGVPTFTGRTTGKAGILPDYALLGLPLKSLALPHGITAIGNGALAGLDIKEIIIPATVTAIGERAFADCKALEKVSLPEATATIGEGAFKGCATLKSVEINGKPDSIAPNTFAGCHSLATILLPQSIKKIGSSAFNGCVSLASINFPAGLTHIGERAFNGTGLTEADLSGCGSLAMTGDWAFAGCSSLSAVTLPAGMTGIGTGTFFNNSSLTGAMLPESMTSIPDFAFTGASGDGNLLKDTAIETIGKYALADWSAVQVFTLPASLAKLEDGAMADWSALDSIKAGELIAVPVLGSDVWGNLDKSTVVLTVNEDTKNEFESTPQWRDFKIETNDTTTMLPAIKADTAPIEAYFNGMALTLHAPAAITAIQIHDTSGRSYLLPVSRNNDGTTACIDTSALDTPVMIVRVVLENGSAASLKLYR